MRPVFLTTNLALKSEQLSQCLTLQTLNISLEILPINNNPLVFDDLLLADLPNSRNLQIRWAYDASVLCFLRLRPM
jgi:hypothetical protein